MAARSSLRYRSSRRSRCRAPARRLTARACTVCSAAAPAAMIASVGAHNPVRRRWPRPRPRGFQANQYLPAADTCRVTKARRRAGTPNRRESRLRRAAGSTIRTGCRTRPDAAASDPSRTPGQYVADGPIADPAGTAQRGLIWKGGRGPKVGVPRRRVFGGVPQPGSESLYQSRVVATSWNMMRPIGPSMEQQHQRPLPRAAAGGVARDVQTPAAPFSGARSGSRPRQIRRNCCPRPSNRPPRDRTVVATHTLLPKRADPRLTAA